MSRHKRNFHSFNAIGGEGSYKSSHPLDHHTTWLPKIPDHGMMAYHELKQKCCLCSACQHAHALDDVENQLLPFHHAHPPYHHHHHPHQYVLSGASRHEETHSASDCHLHHQRYNKKIVLVKNSDPSFRKTIILDRRGLQSFGLFLEEVSELMQYHIRKLYTQEGCKIDSIQSLLQCPGVLVCVGREPSHPLVTEDFEKTSSFKLPKLSGKSCPTERTDGNERFTTKTNIILPNLEDDKRATKHSVSSDKSVPDGRDSPDFVNSCPPSGNSVREDDIEKRVRVNKDGSLSMEMKVCFRLPNDETLHWSTTVKKTAGRTYDHIKAHNIPNSAQISDVNCSESEIISADEAYFTHHHQEGHKEKPHCPYCCSHCQGYETWKNVPGTHGARRCSHTSSSSASSRTVVSRKTVIEKQTMSRSSEELADQVVETCITESIEAAEMVEFCTIQRETCSPKCNVKLSTVENGETTDLYKFPKNVDLKTAQESDQKEEEEPGSATCDDGSFSQISNSDTKETNGSEVLVPKDKASKTSEKRIKPKTSKPSHICHCGEPEGVQIESKEKNATKDGAGGQMHKVESSAMSVKSHAVWSSYKLEEIQKVDCAEEGRVSKSAMSVNSKASTTYNSAVPDVSTEGFQAGDDKEKIERTPSSLSVKSFKSTKSVKAPQHQPEEDVEEQAEDDAELRSQSSLSALSSVSAELKNLVQESDEEDNQATAEENEDFEPRVNCAISKKSNGSRTPGDKTEENLEGNQVEGGKGSRLICAASGKSILKSVSPTSRTSVRATTALSAKSRESKTPELYDTKKTDITENDNTEGEGELRPQSKLSVKSEKSVKSNISAKSNKLNQTKDYYCNIAETPDTSEARASSVVSETSAVIATEQNSCGDDGTTERAGSVMSVKSGKSHTSVVSLKSETSQVSTTHSGNLCDERNNLYATAGRSSCMSDKSIKSNISARSSNPKACDNLNKDDVADEEQREPSAMSAKSNVTTKSGFSKASGKSNLSKQSDEVVEGTSGDHTEQRERAPSNISTVSAKSSKSHASAGCVKEVCRNPSDGIFSEEEIEGRSVSSISVQSNKSNISLRSGRTICSTCTQVADATESFIQDSEEMNPEDRAANCASTKSDESQTARPASSMSATSTKSKNSTKSTKSNSSNICSSRRPGEETTEEAIPDRALSVLSVRSTKSTISIESTKSKCFIHDQQQKSFGQENDKELLQDRPTSKGSHVSQRSVKSAERPHSVLSDKSKVSDIDSCASVEISDNRDGEKATEQRTQSALSVETVRSTISAKSTKAAEQDELHENITNNDKMVERAASNMSARSERSTKSNISKVSKCSKVDAGCLEVVCPDERVVEGENEFRSVSPQSVDSIVSTKSNKSMHSANAGEEDGTLVNEEGSHKHGEERPPSSMSAKSIQSCVSEISINSAGRTPSSLSAKSVKTSTTEACSGKCPVESNIEEAQVRAESVMSSKTERSTSSAKSSKSKGLDSRADENVADDNGHMERSPSNLLVRSEKSTKSNVSKGSKRLKVHKRSKVYEVDLENSADNSDVRIVEGESEGSTISFVSAQSVKSECERCDDENPKRPPSSISAKSSLSHVSEKSAKSANRPSSASSARSAKSDTSAVKSNISDSMSGKTVESQERTNSVLSSKTARSATSTKSSKVKEHTSSTTEEEDGEYEDRNPSGMSARSVTSAKSNISKVSQESKASAVTCEQSAKSGNEDDCQEEHNESRSVSSMSIHSIKSDISARSGPLKCSSDIPVQEIITQSNSPASVISIKSNSSGVFSDTNQTGERTDNKASQDRSESEMSATEGCVCGFDQIERPASNLSVNSAKSAMSNVTGTSTKSKTSNIPSENEQEITASDIEEEGNSSSSQVTKSNVSGCSKKSRSSDVAAARSIETPSGDNSDEIMQDRAASCTSVTTGCSHGSERGIGSKAFSKANEEVDEHEQRKESAYNTLSDELAKSLSTESEKSVKSSGSNIDDVPAGGYVAESNSIVERAESQVSDRSAKTKSSTKSKRSTGKENSKEESLERSLSCMSTSSVTESVEQAVSTRSSKTNISRISATVSQVSDTTLNNENTNERSSSNISTNVKTSSRVTTPSEVTSVDGTSNGEGKTQRPSSTWSAKSAKSSKSSKSTKSSKLQISNKPDEEISVEDMKRTPSNSRHSDNRSNNSEILAVSPENVADEKADDTEIKTLSPVSAKSLKTNISSVSTKSKASHSQKAKEDQSQRSHSVLSIKSDTSSRTIQSNGSCIYPREETGIDEDNDSMSEAKSGKLIDPDIPKEESDPHKDGNFSEKSERTQSPISTKSQKSKNYCVPAEESSTYVEERAFSPVSAKSAKSDPPEALSRSEVPSVTIEESEDRSPTATSSKSKASGRSKKSRTSEIHGSKSSKKSQSSLSVHSHMSVKSKKTNVTDVSSASMVSDNTEESVTPSEVKEGPTDKRSSKTNRSREQGKGDAGVCLNKHPVICHADSDESDLSQTLSCSDKEICETSSPGKSKSHVSDRIVNGSVEATDTVSDKSDKGSKHKEKNDSGDFDLVPSILPNASPTEVVNEWLKTLPTERVLYEMEELNEDSGGVKDNVAAEETDTAENAEKNESDAENSKEVNGVDNVQNDCQTCLETPTEGNTCTQREDGSTRFNSSIQVMKVLLNPKLDRCNSLPEISPVYGRKLSTSAQGLLDCLVKLQLIDHDPKNANEKNERYQELMSILQSLWLSNPSKEEHVQNTSDHHSVEGEYNHTSSSGVDVNSGSTGSGKSSDGVKSSNNVNIDGSQPQNSLIAKTYNETDAQQKSEIEEVNQEEEDPATDETIRSNDSPREPPETPSSSNKSSGESSSNDEKLSKKLSQDSDPVWVLTLLNKIERQFMMHYISAMKELKVRWSLGDADQLDSMIDELKTEVHNKIQISIDREVRKIQGRVGLPKPPTEATSRTSNKQTEERRRGVKLKLQQSMESQGEKSDSTTRTFYSDQRGENIDEYCPCETCVEQNFNSIPSFSTEERRIAPVVMDYDLKRILLKKTATDCAVPCGNDDDTITAETLVEKVIIGAIKEVEINKMQQSGEEAFEFTADEEEADDACQDDQTAIEESVKVFAVDYEEKTGKAGVKRPRSESGAIHTEEPASEKVNDDAITPGGESGFIVNSETAKKDADMLSSVSEDEDEEQITEAKPVKYITASTKQFPTHANEVHDDTVAFTNTEDQSKEETEQGEKDVSVEASSSTKLEACHKDAKKDWLKLRRQLLPSVQIIVQMKNKKQSMMSAENNDTVTINEMVNDQTEEEESEAETDVVQETIVPSENEPSEEIEYSETEDKEPAVEVSVAQTSDVKSSEEENEESFLEVASNTTLSEDEKKVMATSEHTLVANLTDQKSGMEEVGEGTSTTSDQDAAEESGGSSDEDESEDERESTINELSSIQEEETTGDELSVTSETELQKNQVSAVGYEGTKKNDEAESEVQESEREEVEEDSTVDQEETISPVNSNDSPDESEAAMAESSGESDEGATTEDDTDVKKQTAVTGEDETVIAANPDQSDCEKAKKAGQVNPDEDTDAEVRKGSSTKSEDENEESETAMSEHKSEKDSAEEEGTDTEEEKLPAVSADEFADENRDSSTEDKSSEEDNKEATTEDEMSTHKEIFPAQNGESKNVTAEDEATAERMENEEAGTVDNEETGTVSESGSAEDINGTTNDDDDAEENDDMSSELSIEYTENQTKDEQTGEEATAKCTSVHKFEEPEEEEVVDYKEKTGKVKHLHALGLASEAEDDQEEDEIDADTTENESGKDEVEETTRRQRSDSKDETNEEKEDKLKEEQSIEATDAKEEDMVKSESEGNGASSNDESSAAEAEHEINKAYNVANEKEPEPASGGEESDVSSETDPESTIQGSSKAVSENESQAENSSSAIDEEKSVNNLRAGKGETTGQEDTSTVKDDDDDDDAESGEEDSDAKSEDEVVDMTPQECTDESESLSQAEPVEQLVLAKELESSGKMEESIDVFQDEKSKEGKTPLEESESVENESDSKSKCEDCSEAVTKGQEDYKLADEDVSEVELIGSNITKSDSGEKSRSKDQFEEECGCEESADEAEDKSVEEKEPQFTENKDATTAALNDSVKDSEKEDEDTDTPVEGWSGSLGDSADGEDEAEEDSEPEEDTADGEKPFVADNLGSLDATKKTAKKTLLIPLDALMKERAESEDGAFADIEDSETEIHGQDDVTSLESKSLKKL